MSFLTSFKEYNGSDIYFYPSKQFMSIIQLFDTGD